MLADLLAVNRPHLPDLRFYSGWADAHLRLATLLFLMSLWLQVNALLVSGWQPDNGLPERSRRVIILNSALPMIEQQVAFLEV